MRKFLLTVLALFAALAAINIWLRAPTFAHQVWNVDEAIHSAVARELLAGGTLYRDAIDQRTPVTYYAAAALYAVAGANNIYALHVMTALLIAATGLLLWSTAREWRRPGAGAWAAALYSLLSVALLYKGDAFAFNTEWCVALFTALAAWLLARGLAVDRPRWFVLSGVALALAFLSKQPALLDAAAPFALGLFLLWRRNAPPRTLLLRAGALAAGWIGLVALVAIYLAARGALQSALYYAWTYNLQIYGPEITTADRLASAVKFWNLFRQNTPLLLPWVLAAAGWALFRVGQRTTSREEEADNPWLAFLLAWSATSLAGAVSGGRGFDHYFIQALPPLCLLAGILLDRAARYTLTADRSRLWRAATALALVTTVYSLVAAAITQRRQTLPPDTSVRAANFVKSVTKPEDRIYVWGYHPEFFLFSERRSASRFVYGSFLTGLVPWTNVAPDKDTRYAIVPGALDTLLSELEARRPACFIDCSVGPNRYWNKYPLKNFPRLKEFVDRHYVLVEPDQFRGQGYDLYLRRDDARLATAQAQGTAAASLAGPDWFGPSKLSKQPVAITFAGSSPPAQLTGLALVIDQKVFAGATFAPVESIKLRVDVPFYELGQGTHSVFVRALGADGSVRESAPRTVEVSASLLPEEQLAQFALAQVADPIRPLFVQTLYGAYAEIERGVPIYFAHAPSTLAFSLPTGARRVSGGFGIKPAAYAADNKSPTDGAEFRVELVDGSGRRRVLLQRLLQPLAVEADRGIHAFGIELPPDRAADERIEFVIGPGPNDNSATDWTFWADLRLESSR